MEINTRRVDKYIDIEIVEHRTNLDLGLHNVDEAQELKLVIENALQEINDFIEERMDIIIEQSRLAK